MPTPQTLPPELANLFAGTPWANDPKRELIHIRNEPNATSEAPPQQMDASETPISPAGDWPEGEADRNSQRVDVAVRHRNMNKKSGAWSKELTSLMKEYSDLPKEKDPAEQDSRYIGFIHKLIQLHEKHFGHKYKAAAQLDETGAPILPSQPEEEEMVARAEGGPVEAGQPALVGEQGPETVTPAEPSQVPVYSEGWSDTPTPDPEMQAYSEAAGPSITSPEDVPTADTESTKPFAFDPNLYAQLTEEANRELTPQQAMALSLLHLHDPQLAGQLIQAHERGKDSARAELMRMHQMEAMQGRAELRADIATKQEAGRMARAEQRAETAEKKQETSARLAALEAAEKDARMVGMTFSDLAPLAFDNPEEFDRQFAKRRAEIAPKVLEELWRAQKLKVISALTPADLAQPGAVEQIRGALPLPPTPETQAEFDAALDSIKVASKEAQAIKAKSASDLSRYHSDLASIAQQRLQLLRSKASTPALTDPDKIRAEIRKTQRSMADATARITTATRSLASASDPEVAAAAQDTIANNQSLLENYTEHMDELNARLESLGAGSAVPRAITELDWQEAIRSASMPLLTPGETPDDMIAAVTSPTLSHRLPPAMIQLWANGVFAHLRQKTHQSDRVILKMINDYLTQQTEAQYSTFVNDDPAAQVTAPEEAPPEYQTPEGP